MKTSDKIFIGLSIIGLAGISYYFLLHKKIKEKKAKGFVYPVSNPYITSPYGSRTSPIEGESESFHNGIDLRGGVGDPVYAPADGTVISQYSNSAGGNQMLIKHTNGYTTGYAHLSAYLVTEDEVVKQGQEIAYIGDTGHVTAAHLHFTLRDASGNLIDPATYLI